MQRLTSTQERPSFKDPPVNKWLVFSIIAFSLFMMTMNSTIIATALSTLQKDLGASVSWVGWTLTAYSLGFVLMLPLSAKLSIQYGHKRIFLISVSVFTLASLFCGLSTDIYFLIFMRIIQAIGGAGITPSATGIIVGQFAQSRDKFLGLFGSIFSVGAMVGPVFGGIFVTYWTWPWIFFINIPIGLAVVLLAIRYIPGDNQKHKMGEKMDFKGLLLLGIAILSSMYAATYLSEEGSSPFSLLFIGLIVVSILAVSLLFPHLKRSAHPFIQPRFITGQGFSAVNIVNIIYSGMVIGAISLVPLYAVNRYGLSEFNSGIILVAEGIASVVLSTIMSMLIRRTGYRKPIFVGTSILTVGIALLAVTPPTWLSPMSWLMVATFIIGVGFGIMSPAGRNAGIQLAPEQSANIAAIRSLGLQLGQIFSIAIATAIIGGSTNPPFAQAVIYAVMAGILLLALPVITKVPENKGAW